MKKTKLFLDQWILFEIFETETKGLYEINAGATTNGKDVILTVEGFDLLFGDNKHAAEKFKDYGFDTINELKLAAVSCLYYTCLSSASTLINHYIINLLRNSDYFPTVDAKMIIYGGRASDNPNFYSFYMDLRTLKRKSRVIQEKVTLL